MGAGSLSELRPDVSMVRTCSGADDPERLDCHDFAAIERSMLSADSKFQPGVCNKNLHNILWDLVLSSEINPTEMSNIRVVFLANRDLEVGSMGIINPQSFVLTQGIRAKYTPPKNPERLTYHAVLVAGGRVFDPSFGGQRGLPMKEYIEFMFEGQRASMIQVEMEPSDFVTKMIENSRAGIHILSWDPSERMNLSSALRVNGS
jgi:hypothetical protein